uniref:SET domain-containing protein n=1 Tax=Corethron hystrix TaxID=216773 RepID=A0A7S1BXH0_9STRA|mmetsp:Transcript_42480/g.99727  ORF Transcript_42480/g.99727 Transcript_42480/m.99727 type:complete len:376 (+) Transcript_42480:455-1582(+)
MSTDWWEVAAAPLRAAGEAKEADGLHVTLRRLCEESAALLWSALEEELSRDGGGRIWREKIFDATFWGRIVGAFELNAIGVRVKNPLRRLLAGEDAESREFRERRRAEILACAVRAGLLHGGEEGSEEDSEEGGEESNEEDSEEDGEEGSVVDGEEDGGGCEGDHAHSEPTPEDILEMFPSHLQNAQISSLLSSLRRDPRPHVPDDLDLLFPPLDGMALFATACKMNHDCDPNVMVRYVVLESGDFYGKEDDGGVVLEAVAIREVAEGEELCISYIDEGPGEDDSDDEDEDDDENDRHSSSQGMPLGERRAHLFHYGFYCNCRRCKEEEGKEESGHNDKCPCPPLIRWSLRQGHDDEDCCKENDCESPFHCTPAG